MVCRKIRRHANITASSWPDCNAHSAKANSSFRVGSGTAQNPRPFASRYAPCSATTGWFTPKSLLAEPEYVLHYLARYTHRVAISNHRLISMKGDQVTFRWKGDYLFISSLSACTGSSAKTRHVSRRGSARRASASSFEPATSVKRRSISDAAHQA